jgi:uncharacterized protein YqgC (DUF456 family)
MLDWLWYISLLAVMLLGLFVNILGLPGLWLLVASVIGYALVTGWNVHVGWPLVWTLVALGILAEIVEFVAGGAGAKTAGGTKRAMIGGIIGAIVGGVFLSFLLPIPIVGTVFGACLGAFLGAAAVELAIYRDVHRAARVGTGAARGRFWGILYKTGIGLVMFITAAIASLPIGATAPTTPALPPPATTPTTEPSTAAL